MSTLDDWVDAACTELGLDPAVAGPARRYSTWPARSPIRSTGPAAPVTAFLLGIAVGSGQQLDLRGQPAA